MSARETQLVELVDDDGRAVGAATVAQAHDAPGVLHRAFSVLLFAPDGRMLLQRRAADKTRFALRWANTCCGHPAPGEDLLVSARRRLREELGVEGVELACVGVHVYRAGDSRTGRVEHEYDHVLVGSLAGDAPVAPDPAEVAELRWASADALRDGLAAEPDAYAPWLTGVVSVAGRG